ARAQTTREEAPERLILVERQLGLRETRANDARERCVQRRAQRARQTPACTPADHAGVQGLRRPTSGIYCDSVAYRGQVHAQGAPLIWCQENQADRASIGNL